MQPRGSATNAIGWRNLQARLHLTQTQFALSRSLSSTKLGDRGYQGEMVNVVGFIRRFQWEFWGQQVHVDDDTGAITIRRIWQL